MTPGHSLYVRVKFLAYFFHPSILYASYIELQVEHQCERLPP